MATQPPRDFAAIDFTAGGNDGTPPLPTPLPTADLETTARKMRALANVVLAGQSLAVRTGYKLAAHQERDPETLARRSMTPQEIAQYDAWRAGARMPAMDWATQRKAVPGGAGAAKRFANRAAAMNTIWNTTEVIAENASWLTFNMPSPL